MTDLERELADAIADAMDHNDAASNGVSALLVGRTVTAAKLEVWSSEGEWSIGLAFDDGSTIDVPGQTHATGPLADLVRMAGGNPDGEA